MSDVMCVDCDSDEPANPDTFRCAKCDAYWDKHCGRCGGSRGYKVKSKFGQSLCLPCWDYEYSGDLGFDDWQDALEDIDKMFSELAGLKASILKLADDLEGDTLVSMHEGIHNKRFAEMLRQLVNG
jgi:hypothetical protein